MGDLKGHSKTTVRVLDTRSIANHCFQGMGGDWSERVDEAGKAVRTDCMSGLRAAWP